MEIIWKVTSWEGEEGKVAGIKKHNRQVQNSQGEVKNSIGNGEAKELTHTNHKHEPGREA